MSKIQKAIKQILGFESNLDYLEINKSNYGKFFPVIGFLNIELTILLEEKLQTKIENPAIFEQALVHRSYLPIFKVQDLVSNERLEFLGDSIFNMVVAEYLFFKHQSEKEGDLSKIRSWIVSRKSLALIAKELRIHEFMQMSFSAKKLILKGADSALADTIEALIAAIYLDSGINNAKMFILKVMLPILEKQKILTDDNFKSKLLEKYQANGKPNPKYKIIETKGPDHDRTFIVGVFAEDDFLLAKGSGRSKKLAEQDAAKNALS